MPQPSGSLATLRPDLGASFEQFSLSDQYRMFGSTRILPTREVGKPNDTFGIIPLAQLAKRQNTKRAPRAPYNRGNWTFTTATFDTTEYGWEEPVDDRESAMYADYFDSERIATERALFRVMLDFELDVAAVLQSATVFSGQTTARTAVWTNYANSKPATDVKAARLAVYLRTGMWPNAVAMSPRAFEWCIESAEIIDRLQGKGAGVQALPGEINAQALARVFNVDEVIVLGGSYDSANAGQAASIQEAWDDTFVQVFRKARTDDFREPCLGRSWHWAQDGSMPAGVVESYRDETIRADVIRARRQMGFTVLYREMGQLITNLDV
jgi:hypothetical protein